MENTILEVGALIQAYDGEPEQSAKDNYRQKVYQRAYMVAWRQDAHTRREIARVLKDAMVELKKVDKDWTPAQSSYYSFPKVWLETLLKELEGKC